MKLFETRKQLRKMVPKALAKLEALLDSQNDKVALQAAKLVVEGACSSGFDINRCVQDELLDENALAMQTEKERDWQERMGKRIPQDTVDSRYAEVQEQIAWYLVDHVGPLDYPAAIGLAFGISEELYGDLPSDDAKSKAAATAEKGLPVVRSENLHRVIEHHSSD